MASEPLSETVSRAVERWEDEATRGIAHSGEAAMGKALRDYARLMRDLRPFILQMGAYRAEDMAKRMGDMADEIDPPKGGKP